MAQPKRSQWKADQTKWIADRFMVWDLDKGFKELYLIKDEIWRDYQRDRDGKKFPERSEQAVKNAVNRVVEMKDSDLIPRTETP